MTTLYKWALGFAVTFTAAVVLWPFPEVTHHLGTLAAGVGALSAWHFVVVYSTHPWRLWAEGRHLMQFTAGLGLVLTLVVVFAAIRPVTPAPAALGLIRLAIFTWLALMLVWRVRLLLAATREQGNEDDRG